MNKLSTDGYELWYRVDRSFEKELPQAIALFEHKFKKRATRLGISSKNTTFIYDGELEVEFRPTLSKHIIAIGGPRD